MEESNLNEFRIIDKLGEGSFADVYKVKSVSTGKIYAEKRLKKRYRSIEEVRALTEVSALRLLSRHPNIISLRSLMYDTQSGHVALIFEQMEMNLYDFLSKRKESISEEDAALLMYQLTKAIAYVHSCGIFHRDVKPENCLVNSDIMELKLADFGSVSPVANRTRFTEYVATRWYRAPECILTTGAYGPPVDVWAIGCVFYEVLTSRPLFPGKHQLDQLNRIHGVLGTPSRDYLQQFSNGQQSKVGFAFPQRQKQTFESLLPNTSPQIVDLIKKMITYDPADRITAADALRHPAFSQLYQLDLAWQKTNRTSPFSVYAMQCRNKIMIKDQNSSINANIDINKKDENHITFEIPQEQQIQSKPPPSLLGITKGLLNQKPNGSHGFSNTSGISSISQMNTLEARRIVAQRKIDYQKRQMMGKANVPHKLADTTKPGIKLGPSIYQKPKPNMIQPRLPPISFQPLKRK